MPTSRAMAIFVLTITMMTTTQLIALSLVHVCGVIMSINRISHWYMYTVA